jgi:hypothetical protein
MKIIFQLCHLPYIRVLVIIPQSNYFVWPKKKHLKAVSYSFKDKGS